MRILIASRYLPWPLIEGGRVAQYRTFEAMRDACDFTLVVPIYGPEEQSAALKFAELFPHISVEAIQCWRPKGSVPRRIARKLSREFEALSADKAANTADADVPYYPFASLNPNFVAAVEKQLSRGCDIFQAEFADMLTLAPLVSGRVPTTFVHHQLHFVYARRFLEATQSSSPYARYITQRMVREEEAYLKLFDSAIVFSDVDRDALRNFCPGLEVNVSPFPSPEDPVSSPIPFEKSPRRFVLVASEEHRPNRDGLRWFMEEAWPELKRTLPGANLEVIGKWSSATQTSLPNFRDIAFSGFVPDLRSALKDKIMIVPVWVGSGIRTKILAAWGACCPVITTTVGAEGLPGQPGEHFVVADDGRTFARACAELSGDVKKLNHITANGLNLVQQRYSLEAVRAKRLKLYEKLLANYQKAA